MCGIELRPFSCPGPRFLAVGNAPRSPRRGALLCVGETVACCSAAYITQLETDIANLSALIAQLSTQPVVQPSKVISYTVNGRQITLNSISDPGQAIPLLIAERRKLYVELARCEAGGIQIFYGVPRW